MNEIIITRRILYTKLNAKEFKGGNYGTRKSWSCRIWLELGVRLLVGFG